jgi:post-segregation antitoxin (ccd killing protein)
MVSITMNSDLDRCAKAAKINISQVAEEAVAEKLKEITRAELEAGALLDILAYNAFVEEHGVFAEHVRVQKE